MTCNEFEAQLSAYIDGELPERAAREMAEHIGSCVACGAAHERQLELRGTLLEHLPAFTAPEGLRSAVRQAIRAERGAIGTRPYPQWRWLAAAALLVGVVAGTWTLATLRASGGLVTEELLASHVRSLQGTHLTDVLSSDQHTVKPWFNGRLDYSPPVSDFAAQGYPLIGGRLDYIAGGTVAVLAYGRRLHMINVFVWPRERGATGGPATLTKQGYHMLHWTTSDYAYWVISDLGAPELGEFSRLLQRGN